MDISFSCDKCGQSIAIDEAGAGLEVRCPKCGEYLSVPNRMALEIQSAGSAVSDPRLSPTKRCRYCAEEILADAIKCKHCGEFLNRSPQTPTLAQPRPYRYPAAVAELETISRGAILFAYVLAVLLPLFGFFAGIYLLVKKEAGHGVACMAVSVFSFLIFFALFAG